MRAGKPEERLRIAAAEGRVEDEGGCVPKHSSRFWPDVVITAVREEAGDLSGFSKVTRDATGRRTHEKGLRELGPLTTVAGRREAPDSSRTGRQYGPNVGSFVTQPVETALFRLAQECLTNVHRHSGSSAAAVLLTAASGQVTLKVADRGKGLPDNLIREDRGNPTALGVGIRGRRESLRQLGSWLDLKHGHPDTNVELVLPFPGESA